MPTFVGDIRFFGTGSMSLPGFELDDTATGIGGAEDGGIIFQFTQPTSGAVQAVASAADTHTVTIAYLDTSNTLKTSTVTLNGTTVVPFTASIGLGILRAFYQDALTLHTDDVAIEDQTAVRTGTAQAGSGNPTPSITLDAGASSVDDFYTGMVLRITGGTGVGQIVKIVKYVGSTKVASIDGGYSRVWPSATPNNTSVFRIAPGIVLNGYDPARECRIPFYNAVALGTPNTYFEKIFIENGGQTSITAATLTLIDSSGLLQFAFETVANGTGDNGAGNNRHVAPTSNVGTFGTGTKNWPYGGQTFGTGEDDGIWLKLVVPANGLTQFPSFQLQVGGTGFTSPAPPAPLDSLWFEFVGTSAPPPGGAVKRDARIPIENLGPVTRDALIPYENFYTGRSARIPIENAQNFIRRDSLEPIENTGQSVFSLGMAWNVRQFLLSRLINIWKVQAVLFSASLQNNWTVRETIFTGSLTHDWKVIPNLPVVFAGDVQLPCATVTKTP